MAPKARNIGATMSLVADWEIAPYQLKYPEFSFRIPEETELSTQPRDGELCVYLEHFKKGFTLPIPEYLELVFNTFGMVPEQLTPNAVQVLTGLHVFYGTWEIEWSIPNILSLISIAKKAGGVYYAHSRKKQEFGLVGMLSSIHGWRSKFVFVSSKQGWNISTVAKEIKPDAFKISETSKPILELLQNFNNSYFALNVTDGSCKVGESSGQKRAGEESTAEVEEPRKKKRKEKVTISASGVPAESDSLAAADEDAADEERSEEEIPIVKRRLPRRGSRNVAPSYVAEDPLSTEESRDEQKSNNGSDHRDSEKDGTEKTETEDAEKTNTSGGYEAESPENVIVEDEVVTGGEGLGATDSGVSPPSPKDKGKKKVSAEEESSGNYSCDWDTEAGICSFPFNDSIRYVPKQRLSRTGVGLLEPLTTDEDERYLSKLAISELMMLQCQMAIGSSIVTRRIVSESDKRRSSMKLKYKELDDDHKKSKERIEALEKELEALKAQSAKEVEELKKESVLAQDELKKVADGLRGECDTVKEHNKVLTKELTFMGQTLKKEKETFKVKMDGYERLIASSKASPSKPACTVEEAEKIYKDTDCFALEMARFSEFGFELMRKVVVKKCKIDPKIVEGYKYGDCVLDDDL